MTLYRLTWSHARGSYWLPMRTVAPDTAEGWLKVFRQDEPCATFEVFTGKPRKLTRDDDANARHVATY